MHKEKTNEEIILETLEEGSRLNEEDEEKLDIGKTKGVKEEKKDPHYRLPMKKIINSYTWANLNKPGKALLPVIGNYQNEIDGHCNLARGTTMAKYVGCSDPTIGEGLKSLVNERVITKERGWPCKNYFLTDKAKWDIGTYFPFFQYQIKAGLWAKLKPCEKALYPVLGVKGSTEHPDIVDYYEIYCQGQIKSIKKFMEWAGIKRPAFIKAMRGLSEKSLIQVYDDGNYYLYRLDCIK